MRKKALVAKLGELVDSHNSLQRQLDLAKRENNELKALIKLLNEQLAEEKAKQYIAPQTPHEAESEAPKLDEPPVSENQGFTVSVSEEEKGEAASIKTETESQTDKTETGETVTEMTEEIKQPEAASENPVFKTPEPAPVPSVNIEPIVNETTDYASVTIGKLVCESVKYTGIVNRSQSENKKELINLIMGKGEIVKSEIFSITESDISPAAKQELIDAQLCEALDYFKSVAEQL